MIESNKIFLILFLTISIQAILNAQSKSYNNPEKYKSDRDSLNQLKAELSSERTSIKHQIDSLKNLSSNIDDNISSILEDINRLYVKKFGKEKANRIINKQIWKGMTEKMLRSSWGNPDKIDKNVEKWGVFTQWYYGDVTFFFRDGKLTDWEENK